MYGSRTRLNWPETAMNLAYDIAKYRSEDPWVQVGAAAIKHDKSIVLGYNGAPSDVTIDWSNREQRRPFVLHAEENVLNYVVPWEVDILAVTHMPCDRCIKLIAQKKIKCVYYGSVLENYDDKLTTAMAKCFGIKLVKLPIKDAIT